MTNKINGEKFFEKLYQNEKFCNKLGKIILLASKLEVLLIKLIEYSSADINYNLTMGKLIEKVERLELLPKNTIELLKLLCEQRNHFTHNIFIILSNFVEDSKLVENINSNKSYIKKEIFKQLVEEKEELSYDDIQLYIERAYQLEDNLRHITESIYEKILLNKK
ncbi:hypothetical protein O8C79_06070 [Aliarcobacter butzleri]|uniref:hypothetical protein n=1 Tax=Aliarcobacter butzleri TaxID=28197 RepID=UPI00263EE66E|nr:hypothetical protein [Aliarcobacter butzleri]MDN5104856.1 hypothetical protein [Aliarcobacter butzleri]